MDRTGNIIAGILIIMGTTFFFIGYGPYFKDNSKKERQRQVYFWLSLLLILAAFLWITVKLLLTK
jgi:hypothetical protein